MRTINGGEEIKVMFTNGEKEFVKVRQLPVRLMTQYAQAIENDAASVELYCDKAPGWSETLQPESFNAIADLGLELNKDFFRAWFQRRLKIADMLRPGASDAIQKELSDAIRQAKPPENSPFQSSSPELRVGAA